MRLEVRKYLYDIQEAARLADRFTSGKDLAGYQGDPMLRFAVERAFAIIGEALAQLARVDPIIAAQFSESRSIIAFRNILIHAYAQVDDRIVWGIVQSKLPVLVREVAALLSTMDEP
jgi:uncharacterized protein with HEPN domain